MLSFYSSNYAANPLLRPRLVLDGPDIIETVYGQTTGAISEDAGSVSGLIGLTGGGEDFAGAFASGSWGAISVDDTGKNWTYTLGAQTEALRAGQVVVDDLIITSISGVSQTISITITGQDDAALVIGTGPHEFAETGRSLSGRLAISDIDSLVAPTFVAASRTGTYGDFNILADGTWSYTLTNAGVMALGSGVTGQELITVNASDGLPIALAFSVTGTDNDNLLGTLASDTLDGGIGADTMLGGLGDDIYHVDNTADAVIEAFNQGTDTVFSSANYSLAGRFVEVLTLTGTANINATGNSQAQTLNGNAGNNILIGLEGTDTLNGGAGNDILEGGSEADSLRGGLGDDVYYVDNAADAVFEAFNEGMDTILSSVTYSLAGRFVEVMTLTGVANINATGNSQAQTLNGNAGNNTLIGLQGTDTLNGGAGNDILEGGSEADSLRGGLGDDVYYVDNAADAVFEAFNEGTDTILSSVTYSLAGRFVEVMTLTGVANINATGNSQAQTLNGNAGNNTLIGLQGTDTLNGGAGNDILEGGSEADSLRGGLGDDVYYVDNAADAVFEVFNEGTDTILSSVTYSLAGRFVEVMTLTGVANINATGNSQAQTLNGNAGNNTLIGLASNDILIGGLGLDRLEGGDNDDVLIGGTSFDTLIGGNGADRFQFGRALAADADHVVDFTVGVDKLAFNATDYGLANGSLGDANFTSGNAPVGGSAQFVYDSATKTLSWDADGTGAFSAVTIATFHTAIALTAADFILM